ncbi:MAG TPA: IniB N-terminal domain-containing protein [Naasia sp.]|jgi:hypothetical protein
MAVTTPLLQFLLSLLGDPEATQEFLADPETTLADHDVHDLCGDDIDAILPLLLDYAPIAASSNEHHTGGNTVTGGDGGNVGGVGGAVGGGGGGGTDHEVAVERLTSIVNNFSYTSMDDRDTIFDQSLNQNFAIVGEEVDFDQDIDLDTTVVSGDNNNVASGHGYVDGSTDNSIDSGGGDVNTGTISDSYNGDDIVGNSGPVNTGTITDSGNTDNSTNDSYNPDNSSHDSGNTDNSVNDSFNPDVDVEVDDINVDNDHSNFENEDSVVDSEFEDIGNEETEVDVHEEDPYLVH